MTDDEIKGLVENLQDRAEAWACGDREFTHADHLLALNAATALLEMEGELKTAGMYTEAHALMDDMAREKVANAEAVLQSSQARLKAMEEATTDLVEYANECRWIELAQGSAFGVIDRQMLGELAAKGRRARQALESRG